MNVPPAIASSSRAGGHQPCIVLLLAVGLGIVAESHTRFAAGAWWLLAAAALTGWLLVWWTGRTRLATLMLLVAVSATAGSWHGAYWHLYGQDHVGRSVTDRLRPFCVRAEIVSGPRWVPAPPRDSMRTMPRGDSSRMEVNLLAVRNGRAWQPLIGRSSVTVDGHLLGLAPGDRIMLFAQADQPATATGPGEFDMRKHLRGERELCRFSSNFPDCVQLEQVGSPWRVDRLLERMRRRGVALLWKHGGTEHAPLAAAMSLGYREQLDRAQWDNFVETGSVHLLAISGLHVGILAFGLYTLARLLTLRRSVALLLVIGVTIGYAMLVELRPPVVRATAIIVIMCLTRLCGRAALSFNSLAAAGLLVLAMNPSDIYRIGPQFSFLAVAVLCATSAWFSMPQPNDPLQRLIAGSRPWWWRTVRQNGWQVYRLVGSSAVIWLIAMPLAMHHYNICSPCAVVVYPLVALPVSLAMLSSFGVLVTGPVAPPVAAVCGWLCDESLGVIERIVSYAHEVPGAYFWITGPSLALVLMFYLSLALYAALRGGQPAARWPMVIGLLWVSCLTMGNAWAERSAGTSPELACTFVNVGHGTCVLLELPGGKRLLYDAGSLGEPSSGERPIAAALWKAGISHLDAVVISHADADHYNALPGLLEKFTVGVVYVSPVMFESEAPALQALRAAVESRGIPLREIFAGDRIATGTQAEIEVLHPPRRGVVGSDNANSIVLDIALAGQHILLPGDLESPGIDDVMAEEPQRYSVVMAPHHGSAGSNPEGFARWTRPEYVIISGGRSGNVEVVKQAYGAVGAQAFYTADHGAIRVEVAPQRVRVRAWNTEAW